MGRWFGSGPSVAVMVTFNDIDTANHPQYRPKVVAGRELSYVDQVVALGRSARRFVPEAALVAVHTQDLSSAAAERLTREGWSVVRGERGHVPREAELLFDRLAGYREAANGADFTMLLDTDMIFVRKPRLELDLPFRVSYASWPFFDAEVWTELFEIAGLGPYPAESMRADAFRHYFDTGEVTSAPFFNGGAVMMRRDAAAGLEADLRAMSRTVLESGLGERVPMLGHFHDMVCLSLVTHGRQEWGMLPPGFNALAARIDLADAGERRRMRLLHYITNTDDALLARHYGRWFRDLS